ncbi:MAG TPA: hypothetical protein VMA37_05275 [Acetobacteraceae bacterium]|nr:hypothetical protein [Acetobacteraceae bacterium]
MSYPRLSLIRPSVRRRLKVLAGGDPARPLLDRKRVEAALHRQMRALRIDRPIVWQDGLTSACERVTARALMPLAGAIPEIALATVRRLARERGLRMHVPEQGAERLGFVAAAKKVAWQAASERTERPIIAAVLDPLHAERTSHPWNARWGERPSRRDARGAIAELYFVCRQPQTLNAAFRQSCDVAREGMLGAAPAPSFAADWMKAWMIAWAETLGNPPTGDDPYGEAGQAAWDSLLEEAGGEAGREVLAATRSNAFAAFVDNALDPIFGAWCALGELNAGSPGGDLARPWRWILRSFWLPFLHMSLSGLALYWATPEAVICLPRPALFLHPNGADRDRDMAILWPDGESHGPVKAMRAPPGIARERASF